MKDKSTKLALLIGILFIKDNAMIKRYVIITVAKGSLKMAALARGILIVHITRVAAIAITMSQVTFFACGNWT